MRKKHAIFAAFRFRDFRLLWIGMLISRIGSEMQVVAIAWHMYELTGSPFSLGLIGLARFLPLVLFSFFSGLAADVLNRKKIMFACQVVMMSTSLVLAWATIANIASPLLIYLLLAINSVAVVFDTPARQSLIPLLVPKENLMNAVSLNTTMWQTSVVLGPAAAGFVIDFLGIAWVYLIDAISFLAVIIALVLMSPVKKAVTFNQASFSLKSIKEGIHFVKSSPLIYSTMILDFFASFFASATTLLPIFAKDILAVGPRGLGFLYAAPSIGGILSGAIISAIGHFKKQGKILLTAVGIYGLATVVFGLSKYYYLSLLVLAVAGAGDIVATIIRNTIRQLNTPDHLRGRMVSINMLFFMGGPTLGEVEAGLVAAALGTPASVVIGGMGTIIITLLVAYFVPKIRQFEGHDVLA